MAKLKPLYSCQKTLFDCYDLKFNNKRNHSSSLKDKSASLSADSKRFHIKEFTPPKQDISIEQKIVTTDAPKWRKITSENLDLSYTILFPKRTADMIFERLENEVEYFSGDLLKVQVFGKWHQIPRKQVSYGDSGLTYSFSGTCVPAVPWTPLMHELKETIKKVTGIDFNFVLVNRYKDGEDHMGEHRDDEKELVSGAPIASLSFGQTRDFIFRHKDARGSKATRKIDRVKLELEHGSLLMMNPPTNNFWYHSLPVRKSARNVRINLTFRKMLLVRKER